MIYDIGYIGYMIYDIGYITYMIWNEIKLGFLAQQR